MLIGTALTTDKQRQAVGHVETFGGPSMIKNESVIFANFDAELLSGFKTSHNKSGPVPKDLIKSDAFQYMGIVLIDPVVNAHAQSDEYYTQRKQALNEACPQFSQKPASLQYCSHDNGYDTQVWQPELGQYNGRVGVYKKLLDDHGKQVQYCLVACAGAEVACRELQQTISDRVENIENWGEGYTGDQLYLSDEFGYVSSVAAANVKRLLSDAAEALEIRIPTCKYVAIKLDSSTRSFPSEAVPDKLQPINTLQPIATRLNVYREVCPPNEVTSANNVHYILQGPAQPIYELDVAGSHIRHGLPSTTGRRVTLPVNYQAGVEQALDDADKRRQYESCKSHVFWETTQVNFDVIPGVFNSLAKQRGQNNHFLSSLVQFGWNPDNVQERWVPVCVKCSDPFYNREQ